MSSRRDSRVHISVRQNDALLEFENFKRKYLLVNKHITKLNSTLSVRVEELNAQISSLYVENLRLRASEISLASQLKQEKEKSHRLIDDAETAVGTLMTHLTGMRTSLSIRSIKLDPPSPAAKRKPPSSPVQPPRETTRLVRPPADTITQIRESEEEDGDEEEDDDTPTRVIAARRPSTSRLPLPKLVSSPPSAPLHVPLSLPPRPSAIPHINLAAGTKRKAGRRNSTLLTVEHGRGGERSPSPVARPVRRSRRSSSEREDEEHEVEAQVGVLDVVPVTGSEVPGQDEELAMAGLTEVRRAEETPKKTDRKGKGKQLHMDWELDAETHSTSERESSEGARDKEKRRFGIKDVTNSPRKGPSEFTDEKPAEEPAAASMLTTPSAAHAPTFDTLTPRPSTSPLLSAASTPATDGGSEGGEGTANRERRTRRSVNYAEPKLNTKMRKPDPSPEPSSRPRASAGTAPRRRRSIPTPSPVFPSDEEGDADVEGSGSSTKWTEGRRKTVHNSALNGSGDGGANVSVSTSSDPYSMWGGEARRHSMAV